MSWNVTLVLSVLGTSITALGLIWQIRKDQKQKYTEDIQNKLMEEERYNKLENLIDRNYLKHSSELSLIQIKTESNTRAIEDLKQDFRDHTQKKQH